MRRHCNASCCHGNQSLVRCNFCLLILPRAAVLPKRRGSVRLLSCRSLVKHVFSRGVQSSHNEHALGHEQCNTRTDVFASYIFQYSIRIRLQYCMWIKMILMNDILWLEMKRLKILHKIITIHERHFLFHWLSDPTPDSATWTKPCPDSATWTNKAVWI